MISNIADARRHHAAAKLLAAAESRDPAIRLLTVAIIIGVSSLARDILTLRLAETSAFSVVQTADLLSVHPDSIRRAVNELLAARLLAPGFVPALPSDIEHHSAADA
jgi:hypothetical protein